MSNELHHTLLHNLQCHGQFLGMFTLTGQLTGEPVNLANCLVNHQSSQCPKYPTLVAAAPIPPSVPAHPGEALRTRVLAVFHSDP